MSGPKVVRVVTREEVIAICRGQLARLDKALAAWTTDARRHDTLSEDQIAAAQRRRDQIAALLSGDRFLQLQKAVPEEIAFLKADQQARLDRAARAAARARSAERREAEAAAALLAALKRSGRAVPAELKTALSAAAQGQGPAAPALSAGFAALSAPAPADTSRLKALAQSLKDDVPARRLEDWLASQPPSVDEAPLNRIETRLAELATLAGEDAAAPYEARLAALRGGADGDRRPLLLDSLALDLGKALAAARSLAETLARLDQARAELATLNPEHVEAASSPPAELADAEAALLAVETAVAGARDALAAAARRKAVLEGLAALGYEVGAELATAWVQDGRIVLRKPAQSGYGVEVAGGAAAERLQMRVVAFGEDAADPARDRDAETLWCGDVTELQARLAAAGATLTIERALPVGATPVKRVAAVEDRSRAREGPAAQSRTQS